MAEVTEFETPKCDKCDLPITTGLMAVFCPHAELCEFWPEDAECAEWVRQMRKGELIP